MRLLKILIPLILIFVSVYAFSSTENPALLETHFIPVGYGDCILLRLPQGETMLIDAGTEEYGEEVALYIEDRGVQRLDVVVITHAHPDHIGGIPKVLERITVNEIWVNQDIYTNLAYIPIYEVIQERNIPWKVIQRGQNWNNRGGVEIACLHPATISCNPNDNSVVLKIQYKEISFLFPGDITPRIEKELLKTYKDRLKTTVLKIPHHGHRSMYSFIETIDPKIAVLTIGPNPYGAPDLKTLKAYSEKGCRVLRTDQSGAIVIKTDGKKIWWETGER